MRYRSVDRPGVELVFAEEDAWDISADVLVCGRVDKLQGGQRILANVKGIEDIPIYPLQGGSHKKIRRLSVSHCPWPVVISLVHTYQKTNPLAADHEPGGWQNDRAWDYAYLTFDRALDELTGSAQPHIVATPFSWRQSRLVGLSMVAGLTTLCLRELTGNWRADFVVTLVAREGIVQLERETMGNLTAFLARNRVFSKSRVYWEPIEPVT